jgi:hypothetical protein
MLGKAHALRCQTINIGGFVMLLPVATKVPITKVVCQDINDIGQAFACAWCCSGGITGTTGGKTPCPQSKYKKVE